MSSTKIIIPMHPKIVVKVFSLVSPSRPQATQNSCNDNRSFSIDWSNFLLTNRSVNWLLMVNFWTLTLFFRLVYTSLFSFHCLSPVYRWLVLNPKPPTHTHTPWNDEMKWERGMERKKKLMDIGLTRGLCCQTNLRLLLFSFRCVFVVCARVRRFSPHSRRRGRRMGKTEADESIKIYSTEWIRATLITCQMHTHSNELVPPTFLRHNVSFVSLHSPPLPTCVL